MKCWFPIEKPDCERVASLFKKQAEHNINFRWFCSSQWRCARASLNTETHTHTQPQTNTRTPANPAWQNPGAKNNMRWRTDYCGSNLWKALNKTHLKWLLRCYFHELAQRTLHVLPVPVFTFQQTMTALTFLLAVILDSHMEKRCNCFVYWE